MSKRYCFAFKRRSCKALTNSRCEGVDCGFYKTKDQQKVDQKRALERIRSLPVDQQDYIMTKYYNGTQS